MDERLEVRWTVNETGCWVWSGAKSRLGYGKWKRKGHTSTLAHRVSYEIHVGPIPTGLSLDHLCRNRACVNPAHLEPVSQRENCRRGEAALRTACPKGHPYDATNTQWCRGRKRCGACNRANVTRYRARLRAAAAAATLLTGCVGKPAICATTWSASTGVEESYMTGRPRPTAEVSVGGELGSDKCQEDSE